MDMTTLNISLPDSMRAFIEEQTKCGGYSTASEYLRTLIREDQKRKAEERLDALLLDGLKSGEVKKLTPEDWQEVRRQLRRRLGERAKRCG
jgi:antitoxin ParD1/3/4